MKRFLIIPLLLGTSAPLLADTVDERLAVYQSEGAADFSAKRGEELWLSNNTHAGKPRSCTSCHGDNAQASGKHARTGKAIKPMAPSVNAERYTDAKKIEKWFKRNCKWTLGRECSAQEKGDLLSYLRLLYLKRMKFMKALIVSLLAVSGFAMTGTVMADDDDHGWQRGPDVRPVDNPLYKAECGSCHFAYQPGFLPARSWKKLMSGLADHFGDNAELSAEDRQSIESYLVANAADVSDERRSRQFAYSIGDKTPLRITEVPAFHREHHELPGQVVKSEKVGSLSNCIACHTQAEKGSFAEREIRIPGMGRWED